MHRTLKSKEKFELKTFFNSFMIALTNVYCATWILYNKERQQNEDKAMTNKSKTLTRELNLLILFISENSLFCMIVIYSYMIGNIHWLLLALAIISYFSHILGVFLRTIYLKKYHVWREIMWKDFWSKFEKNKTDNSDDDSDTEQTDDEETNENDGSKKHSNNKNRPISYIFPPEDEIRNAPLTPT